MTDEDKLLITKYMRWWKEKEEYFRDKKKIPEGYESSYVNFDLNDASLVVQKMQKRGEWWNFLKYANTASAIGGMFPEQFIALLFNAENFFTAMAQWIKEGK